MKPRKRRTPGVRARSWRQSNLPQLEKDYSDGDRMALAHVIALCASHRIPLPPWAADAFVAGFRDLINLHAADWESIFGPAVPKGCHVSDLRNLRKKSYAVWLAVERAGKTGVAIDDELFAKVGEPMNIAATTVKKYYAAEKKAMQEHRRLIENDEEQTRTWCESQLESARLALKQGQKEQAVNIMKRVQRRLDTYYGVNKLRG